MDISSRRSLLGTSANPRANLDYICELEWKTGATSLGQDISITLRYVPDRLIVMFDDLPPYTDALSQMQVGSLEELGVAVLDDFRNELVARWVQVSITIQAGDSGTGYRHKVVLEDYQPNWENEDLLAGVKAV